MRMLPFSDLADRNGRFPKPMPSDENDDSSSLAVDGSAGTLSGLALRLPSRKGRCALPPASLSARMPSRPCAPARGGESLVARRRRPTRRPCAPRDVQTRKPGTHLKAVALPDGVLRELQELGAGGDVGALHQLPDRLAQDVDPMVGMPLVCAHLHQGRVHVKDLAVDLHGERVRGRWATTWQRCITGP